ncbi:FecCD family ABC transporter permease [Paenibacillus silvisoli]|uniref:FecCD family ABC transporter permease n=1 Tax=Paenibacillus silvisoli TaxID=3110539 RepID=UPI002803FD56|nr:iron ABC transporter permease [Paenibacillus silvisoli]
MEAHSSPHARKADIRIHSRPAAAMLILIGGILALIVSAAVSICVGAADISLSTVWDALFHFNGELTSHQVIRELRIPRVLAGALTGAAFAASGAIMQGMTRNPLADSGLLGINAGAGVMLAICFAFFPGMSFVSLMLFSFVGAAAAVILVFGTGAFVRGGLTPVRLVLAGAAVSALLIAISDAIAIRYNIGRDLAFFMAGGMQAVDWAQIRIMSPWVIGCLIGAVLLSRSITLLSLGEDIAVGLGQRTGLIKTIGMLLVLILAGASVSVVGAVGFVGLIIPHVARYLVGVDYRWIIPCSAVLGSLLIVVSDIGARLFNPYSETPLGALIALIGVPFFLYLAMRERREL